MARKLVWSEKDTKEREKFQQRAVTRSNISERLSDVRTRQFPLDMLPENMRQIITVEDTSECLKSKR